MSDNLEDSVVFEHLNYEIEGNIAILTLSRPEVLNAINEALLMELGLALQLVEADVEVRALVVTGEGRAFGAGADIVDLTKINDAFSGREASLAGQEIMNSLASTTFPTIAAIDGFALGGALELALACDLRIASPETRLGFPEVGLGLIPCYGGTQRLSRLVGLSPALDMILTGRQITAKEALQIGLVNRISEETLQTALEIANIVARNAPIALGLAKEAVVRGLDVTLDEGLEIEADLFGLVTTTNDYREGTNAFIEKRNAKFQGE
ncbi:MAG: enoyl-CoA hydratase-related protein [Deinococcales bacterium]|nr:enoyl-CoA hydratase-related protein [Deinococcales bacterium]|tara:strand:+ start:135 stop:935 length:801 start_codon:yes stop_codon:yes gene_type:complete